MKLKTKEIQLKGTPICRGIAIGKPFFFAFVDDSIPEFSIDPKDIDLEVNRYKKAVIYAKEEMQRLKNQLEQERIIEGAAIMDAHQEMMQDPLLNYEVEKLIRSSKKNAEFAFQSVINSYSQKFGSITDPFFRERFNDIQDISRRIMGFLKESVQLNLADIPIGSIVFAKDFSPSDIAEVNKTHVTALISEIGGGITSHAAIVAKAKGIPFVASVEFGSLFLEADTVVIVDGRSGDIIINPTKDTLIRYGQLLRSLNEQLVRLETNGKLKPETFDGYTIRLSANLDMVIEAEKLMEYGGCGVGLFRSEHVFLSKENFPTEEEQYSVYKSVVEKIQGFPIVIRTFDIGGDKLFQGKYAEESNPYLGCRAIRLLLKEREVFKTQLRAILRASLHGEVSIMFPMVSALSELQEAKAMVREVESDLRAQGQPINPVRIGCMIEVPSAAIISDLLAKECDFLSIGTNDLVQYALAVARDNHGMRALYTPAHPSVIRLIKLIVSEASFLNVPVSLCGEVAADPRYTALLLGLGVNELSVASRYIPLIKNTIRNISIVEASQLAEKVLSLTLASEIEALLDKEYKQSAPEDNFYNYTF